MKLAVFAILASTAVAFTPPAMTFAVGKKAAAKKVVPAKTVAVAKKAEPKAAKAAAAKPTKAAATKAVAKPAAKFANPFAKKAAPVAAAAPTKKVAAKKVVAPKVVAKKAAPKVVAKKVVAPKVVAKKVVAKKVVAPKVVAKKAAPVKKIVVKKAPVKKIVKKAPVSKSSRPTGTIPSRAIPYELAPAMLDGSLIGDVGFDPCFLSTKADTIAPYFNGIFAGDAPIDGLTWYREAELMHGRISMIAVVGFIAPGFGTFAGNEWTDSFGYTNPLEAINGAPAASLFQIFAFMSGMEFRRISIISAEGAGYTAGDSQKWGQGDGSWNPLGLNYTPAEYAEKQLQEIKHARLAMIGLLGLVFQANASGVGVVDQLSSAFVIPGYAAKAGYFLPEGI